MTITTIRKSDTELQVEQTLYVFARKEEAEAFQQCLVNGTVEGCYRAHPPVSMRPARADERADDPSRDSTISPSLGGDTAM
ncbi:MULTISPECIES: hypothetical protein [Paraburkholderia]|uniref:Uncharacterized protein n=1 Tax=Paraburkholderia caribensis TaxID=75105 RepID=A0A9Q6SC27_9BURK|nr:MULTISPECIES: hypothetical protein [Paraburkholderia]ALP68449.1 hypothetical protein AN416_36550 [Paraburkholderia caribensis]AMV47069.1 hypothetical protein ATN79_41075 [Paraburkholderia caribensis]AUT57645.1 hypothetical protein C2L66_30625 [Paraburkholderia caribensis]MCO4881189.1 hypothetical protein [Paraburkholderia caribensis]MDR6384821.1 hypothetical protein [Paraburkholderia caribensis]